MTKCPICSKKVTKLPCSKSSTFLLFEVCFSFTDKHSSEAPSDLSHSLLIAVTLEVCRLRQMAIYFYLLFYLTAFQNKSGRRNTYSLTKVDLSQPDRSWSNLRDDDSSSEKMKPLSRCACTWRLTDCHVMTHPGQQRVVKIYSEGSTLSHLHLSVLIRCQFHTSISPPSKMNSPQLLKIQLVTHCQSREIHFWQVIFIWPGSGLTTVITLAFSDYTKVWSRLKMLLDKAFTV